MLIKIKNFIIIFVLILLPMSFLENAYSEDKITFQDRVTQWYNSQDDFFKYSYFSFLSKIGKEDVTVEGWSRIRASNDKLIIGSSGTVWCSVILGDEMDRLGYDSVGFGGVPDEYMKEWIKKIKKKYKKVIVFSGMNTLDICTQYKYDVIDSEVFTSVVDTLMDISKKLIDKNGLLCYVKIKERTEEKDLIRYGHDGIKRYNKLANQFNYLLDEMKDIKKLTINYPTDERYSAGYVHYNKKEVWEDLLTQ